MFIENRPDKYSFRVVFTFFDFESQAEPVQLLFKEFVMGSTATLPVSAAKQYCMRYCVPVLNSLSTLCLRSMDGGLEFIIFELQCQCYEFQYQIRSRFPCSVWNLYRSESPAITDVARYRIKYLSNFSGDSGGPLIILDGGRYYLVGITSAGFGCGVDHQPGIYHNVKLTASWIRTVIAPINYIDF